MNPVQKIPFLRHFNPIFIFLILAFDSYSLHRVSGYKFNSVVTFNEEYIGKALKLGSSVGGIPSKNGRWASSSEDNQVASILPICCSMETDDVMFFECQNTLSTSSRETVFKQKTWIAPRHLVSTKMSTKFRFEKSFLKCNPRGFTASLSLNSSTPRGSYFLPDGYLKHGNEYFRPDEYCISGLNKERVELQICQVNCSDPTTPCIQKCCGRDQIYSFGYGDHPRGCVDSEGAKWFPTLYHDLERKLTSQELIQLNPHIIHKFPTSFKYNCRFNKTTVFPHGEQIAGFLSSFTQKSFRNLEFRLRKDGWLLYPNKEDNGLETPVAKYIENYCIDGVQDYGESTEFTNTESNTILFLCSGGVDEGKLDYVKKIKPKKRRPIISRNLTTILETSTSTTTSTSIPTTTTEAWLISSSTTIKTTTNEPTIPITITTSLPISTTEKLTSTTDQPSTTSTNMPVVKPFDTNTQSVQSDQQQLQPVTSRTTLMTTLSTSMTSTTASSPALFLEVEPPVKSEIFFSDSNLAEIRYTGNNLGQILDPKLPKPFHEEIREKEVQKERQTIRKSELPVRQAPHLGQLLDPKLPRPYTEEVEESKMTIPEVPNFPEVLVPQVPKFPEVLVPQVPKFQEVLLAQVPTFPEVLLAQVPTFPEVLLAQVPKLPEILVPQLSKFSTVPDLSDVPVLKSPNQPILHPIPQRVEIVTKPNLAQILKKKPTALSQTTFNHNNNHIHGFQHSGSDYIPHGSDALLSSRQGIPTCCSFSPDVNDGFTHHCRNRRMDLSTNNGAEAGITYTPTWNVPAHFMTNNKGGSFLLNSIPLNCGPGKFQFQGFIHNFEQERAKSPGEKKHGLLADGFIKYENEFYGPNEYCINGLSPRIVEVLICKPDCSMWETPCLKKCCGLDEVYNLGLSSGNRGCQPLGPNEPRFNPTLYKDMITPLDSEEMRNVQAHFVQQFPPNFQHTCYNNLTLAFPFSKEIAEKLTPADSAERGGVAFKHLNFRFRKDGKLIYTYHVEDGTSFDSIYNRGEYCVDAVRDFGELENNGISNREYRDNQTILFICASEPH